MAEKGYLDGKEMASAFRLLRSQTAWSGTMSCAATCSARAPPAFRCPVSGTWTPRACRRNMHSWYLRNFYLENLLIKKDALTLAGEKNRPRTHFRSRSMRYRPRTTTSRPGGRLFRIKQLRRRSTPIRAIDPPAHILGIVNPVVNPPKRDFHVGAVERHDTPGRMAGSGGVFATAVGGRIGWRGSNPNPDRWRHRSSRRRVFPALADAPGTYVLETLSALQHFLPARRRMRRADAYTISTVGIRKHGARLTVINVAGFEQPPESASTHLEPPDNVYNPTPCFSTTNTAMKSSPTPRRLAPMAIGSLVPRHSPDFAGQLETHFKSEEEVLFPRVRIRDRHGVRPDRGHARRAPANARTACPDEAGARRA
jgi:hypothetical protein